MITIEKNIVNSEIESLKSQLKLALAELDDYRQALNREVINHVKNQRSGISELRQAETALVDSEELYRTLFENANDAIFIMHKDRFIDCNARTLSMFNCTMKQIIGAPPYRFSPKYQPDGRKSMEIALEKIGGALKGQSQYFYWQHCHYDGTVFDAEVGLTHLVSMGKDYIMAIVRDVSARMQAEQQRLELQEQLERAQRMESIGLLAGGVAHDLNNMLGPLVGYPDGILRKLHEDSPIRSKIKKIAESAQSAADIIQDLLTLARRGRCELTPLSLNEVVSSYLESASFTRFIDDRCDIKLSTELDEKLPLIAGSTPHLTKIIMNLIINSVDAMPTGGTITISTEHQTLDRLLGGYEQIKKGRFVLLRVRDTGIGIPASQIDLVFEPYFSRKKMGKSGSGLGLSVVYGTVKDHHGYYDIFSEENKGTEFILYFPVTDEDATVKTTLLENPGGEETILVVDDIEEQRDVARELLSSLGYKIHTVKNGQAAIAFLKTKQADLVVLDMIMEEGFDGLDTYKQILRINPDQRAVIVSGFSATDRVQKMQALGAGSYIRKPYTLESLSGAVRKELDKVPAAIIS